MTPGFQLMTKQWHGWIDRALSVPTTDMRPCRDTVEILRPSLLVRRVHVRVERWSGRLSENRRLI